MPLLIILK